MRSLRPPTEEQDDGVSSLREVNPITGAEMDTKFGHTPSHRPGVTEVPKHETVDASDYLSERTLVFEPSLPLLE